MALIESANESAGKSVGQIRNFLETLIGLRIQLVLGTENRIGFSSSEKLEERQPAILSYYPTRGDYFFNSNNKRGASLEDGHIQYQSCVLQKLGKMFSPWWFRSSYNGLYVPEKLITAELYVSYTEHWVVSESRDICNSNIGRLKIRGRSDDLIEKIHRFLRE